MLHCETNDDANYERLQVGEESLTTRRVHAIHIGLPINFDVMVPKIINQVRDDMQHKIQNDVRPIWH